MSKKVLITGANKGIGFEIARLLLESSPEYEKIILTARNKALGEQAVERLGGGSRLDFHVLDITSEQSIVECKDYVASKYGFLDVLINNAAIINRVTENFHLQVKPTLATNFYGTVKVTEIFLPVIRASGHILNISAELGKTKYLRNPRISERLLSARLTMTGLMEIAHEINEIGENWAAEGWYIDGLAIYCHSKALLNAYTRLLAKETKENGSGIRVNAVHPGWVQTDMGGENAELPLSEGGIQPLIALNDQSQVTGKILAFGEWNDFC